MTTTSAYHSQMYSFNYHISQVRVGVANYEAQESSGGSLTDSSKLEQQRTDASSSQTDEHKAMHTPQTCSHAAPNSVPCLADTGRRVFLSSF